MTWGGGATLKIGPTNADTFSGAEGLVISPGVHPEQDAVQAVRERGCPVFGELELVGQIPAQVVGITGTNGKSTTTVLIGELARAAGKRVFVGGNLGQLIVQWLEEGHKADIAVVELSSFQLETSYRFAPDVSMILNLSDDHSERYAHPDDYTLAKRRLVEFQRPEHAAILNLDDARIRAMSAAIQAKTWWFSSSNLGGRDGSVVSEDRCHLQREGHPLRVLDLRHPRLLGRHARLNAAAALLAAEALDLPAQVGWDALLEGYRRFGGLEHRLEPIGVYNGVCYINDSKATNDAAAAEAVVAMTRPIVLLAGGESKGAGYRRLLTACEERVVHVIAFGSASREVQSAFVNNKSTEHIAVDTYATLEEGVAQARKIAQPAQAVLLAPACSSYDEFSNYAERGNSFKRWVKQSRAASAQVVRQR